ncbi:hypothetical protein EMPS_02353 [Entomortierella parvispora]|uniref:Tail specific protease domain-containing protein n=1 Tax=Entomortierella parvispora TaxID=205924 RepID=A0A9P3H4K3_9FUNG|nr:hypothetical protein EMPS_02353 [Entomortierella parvispora]
MVFSATLPACHHSRQVKKSLGAQASRIILLCAAVLSAQARVSGPNRLSPEYTDLTKAFERFSTEPIVNVVSTTSPASQVDYCAQAAAISQNSSGIVPYHVAKGCYQHFDFDPRIRDDTIDGVRANLESFYVFYDIAKSPPPMENSDLGPVDLAQSLDAIKNTTFENDYTFHSTLGGLIAKLQDPHTTYKNMCYQQFLFIQPISTYGVFEDGRQQVKVATVLDKLDQRLSTGFVDCEVTHIDGLPAFDVVAEFAKTKSYSKDRGVRLNKAFSYLAHDRTGSSYDRYSLGTFAQRSKIPPNGTVEYKIDCTSKYDSDPASAPTVPMQSTLDLAWSALDATMAPYYDATSYRIQFCSDDSIQTVKKFVLDSASADDFSAVKARLHEGRKKAREIYRGPYASFHMLNDGTTAVFRLGTESPNKLKGENHFGFYSNIDDGFAAMEEAGATKLIIDLQNNSGGIICWGRYVLQTLFPDTVESPYIYTLKASPLAQALAKATFTYTQKTSSPYAGLVDPNTGDEVSDESWIIPGTSLPGREGYFSNKVTDRYCPAVDDVSGSNDDALFEPENIVILTNGFCGSTCAVLALQLHERYGIRTAAIGGYHGQSMAFTSFPGGAVQANNTLWVSRIQQVYQTISGDGQGQSLEKMIPQPLPANGQLAFTFRQVLSASHPDQVSEYLRMPSEFRMDYTSARFRMPSILWEDVRHEVWGVAPVPTSSSDNEEDTGEEETGETGEAGDPEDEIESAMSIGEEEEEEQQAEMESIVVVEDEESDEEMERAAEEADREDAEWMQRRFE